MKAPYTIILGAEGELGKAIAREVAKKGSNLIIVSTTSYDLQRFAIELQLKEDVQVDAVKLDLSDPEAIGEFTRRIREKYEVRALINNITCDWSTSHNRCISEIATDDFQTRFKGAARITRDLLPGMTGLSFSYIQHIIPFPFRKEHFSQYMQHSISRMYAFTRELDEELKDTTVSVSLVHPAPIRRIVQQLDLPRDMSEKPGALTPGMIAIKAVNGMLRGDRLIIPGFWNRVQFFLKRNANSWSRADDEGFGSSLQPV
ncbi:MAG: SDR family NAD(P)-dependent oxidoreductase [Bacteroidetes bacterium]|nr:MAG: SDR family NAD(P)-dependent oxidoreductase [Bacteroidota bacterium]